MSGRESPCSGSASKRKSPLPERISPLGPDSRTEALPQEKNQGLEENRVICTASLEAEEVGFPFACQGARWLRQTRSRKDEEVALITSATPERLNPAAWLQSNRQRWGMENGLHQRLDVSLNDDRCRVQSKADIWLFGMVRRRATSLYLEWRSTRRRPEHVTTNAFQARLAEDHRREAIQLATTSRPSTRNFHELALIAIDKGDSRFDAASAGRNMSGRRCQLQFPLSKITSNCAGRSRG